MLRILGFALALSVAGCSGGGSGGGSGSDPGPDPVCEAGRAAECPCVDGANGVQVCDDDGGGWGECECATEVTKPPVAYQARDLCKPAYDGTIVGMATVDMCGFANAQVYELCEAPSDGYLEGCKPGPKGHWTCCI